MIEYKRKNISIADELTILSKRNRCFQRYNLINQIRDYYEENNFDFDVATTIYDGEKLVGFICFLPYGIDSNQKVISLSCGLIDEKYRGKGLASKMFLDAFCNMDMVLDISPTAQVYKMLLKKQSGIKAITDYQIWYRPKNKKHHDCTVSYSIEDVLIEIPDSHKSVVMLNQKHNVKFVVVSIENIKFVVGYYTFNRSFFTGFEIIYTTSISLLSSYFDIVVDLINSSEKVKIVFCDHIFIQNRSFDGEICAFGTNTKTYINRVIKLFLSKKHYVKTANRRLFWSKSGELNLELGYLSTEVMFYHSR